MGQDPSSGLFFSIAFYNGGFFDGSKIPANFKWFQNRVPNMCQTQVTSHDAACEFDTLSRAEKRGLR